MAESNFACTAESLTRLVVGQVEQDAEDKVLALVVPPTGVGIPTNQVSALLERLVVELGFHVVPPYALGRACG